SCNCDAAQGSALGDRARWRMGIHGRVGGRHEDFLWARDCLRARSRDPLVVGASARHIESRPSRQARCPKPRRKAEVILWLTTAWKAHGTKFWGALVIFTGAAGEALSYIQQLDPKHAA